MLELVKYHLQPAKDEERCFKYNSLKMQKSWILFGFGVLLINISKKNLELRSIKLDTLS